jgi:hypothetical protein
MKSTILRYLGYPLSNKVDTHTLQLIQRAEVEIDKISEFRYTHQEFDTPLPFLSENSSYLQYLHNRPYLLISTTLGINIDRYIQRLQILDMTYATVFDAVASAYLEWRADNYGRQLGYTSLDFRFCPGYGGTEIADNKRIGEKINAERIGINFLDSGIMLPSKSMVGIIAIGLRQRKNCAECVAFAECIFRKRGERCYGE